ncbi:helix-turn-helix domain-containing protein [Streptacidiphilus cavernicola]|uniref:Helix-turn-helix domain-containing protein n=1 Tax=Streptacidiphilus cavernicola TaxID=3342716 RepID=A0ABV6VS72_9ACTN
MSSSSVTRAREALGQRLREIRKDSGLTARALAELCSWHESKCSRIEHGRVTPSDADLRAWALNCGVAGQAADLIATARGIDGMYVEWRRMESSGLKRAQESVLPLWERTRRFRAYSSWLIPGPLQTRPYIEALLSAIRDRREVPDDLDAAVQVRIDKQQILRRGGHRFALLLEESVLRHRIGTEAAMAEQLGHLLSVASLPAVSLGIVPFAADRSALWPVEDFWIFDDTQVNVELVSAYLTISQPHEIRMYVDTFAALSRQAVFGGDARRLIGGAIQALG